MKTIKIIVLALLMSIALVNISYATDSSNEIFAESINMNEATWSKVYNGMAHSAMGDDLYVEILCRQEFGRDAYMAKIYTNRNGQFVLVSETTRVRYEDGQYSFDYNGHTYYTRR